jgi:hypothetical protein
MQEGALVVEAEGSSEMLATMFQITRYHISEGLRLKVLFLCKYLLLGNVGHFQSSKKCISFGKAVCPL